MKKYVFPFCAVTGQDAMKKALLLNAINPRIGGVLINGEKGTAKSTLVRGLGELLNEEIINVPLNTTEDRLVGSIDIEKTLKSGQVSFLPGLLSQADNKILYVDEVNLLGDHLVDIILEVSGKGENTVERENISYSHKTDFVLIGTMNMEEGLLRPQLLDRFGLFVSTESCSNPEDRVEVIKNRIEFERNTLDFISKYEKETLSLKKEVARARKALEAVVLTDENIEQIVELCLEANVQGHRADVVMGETAKALAALYNDTEIKEEYIDEAAYFALPHRQKDKSNKEEEEEQPDNQQDEQESESNTENNDNHEHTEEQEQMSSNSSGSGQSSDKRKNDTKTQVFDIGADFKVKKFSFKKDKKSRSGDGKRTTTNTQNKSGRYVYSTSQRKNDDLALDATIRAAAPFQKFRDKKGLSIAIHTSDIREKVRQKKISNLLVFVVDSSGSMGANDRMRETKGAIISLLKDAYVKRDKIAMVSFRGQNASVLLPPTGSVQRGYKLLQTMETGGKTPLNDGISKGLKIIKSEQKKNPLIMPMMIIISDCRGNIAINEKNKPKQELMEIGEGISKMTSINTMVIDIEKSGMMSMGIAKELARVMGSQYYKIDTLKSDSILKVVKENII